MATQHLNNLLSTLSTATSQNWKKIQRTKNRHKQQLARLLRLKAFEESKFTDSEKYQRGRSFLEQKSRCTVNSNEKQQRFRQLMGANVTSGGKRAYLDRNLMNEEEVKEVFRQCRRSFGEANSAGCSGESKTQLGDSLPCRHQELSGVSDTNSYVVKRMTTLMRCNSISKATQLRMTISELQSPSRVRSAAFLAVRRDGLRKKPASVKAKLGRGSSSIAGVRLHSQFTHQ